jgi:hypothetical protein
MTPEERNLVTDLFDRLATLEDAPRDRDAERLVQDGLRQAPNAPYALVQTVLIQDEALKRADARIRQLEAERAPAAEPPRPTGFLDSMRESVWGRRDTPRAGSVPTVRPADSPTNTPTGYSGGTPSSVGAQPMGQPSGGYGQPSGGMGGSFLGTAAATAVGVIGSSLLLRSIMGGPGGTAHGAVSPPSGGSPWGGSGGNSGGIGSGTPGDSSGLANQAGLNDIGRSSGSRDDGGASRSHGLTDGDTSKAADERNEGRNTGEDNQGRYATGGDQDDHQADGGRYSAEDNEQDFGETDEGDFGGDGGDDQ